MEKGGSRVRVKVEIGDEVNNNSSSSMYFSLLFLIKI